MELFLPSLCRIVGDDSHGNQENFGPRRKKGANSINLCEAAFVEQEVCEPS